MKITVEITDQELKGIKAYLKDLDEGTKKEDIKRFIQGIVSTNLQSPAESVSNYINQS